MNSAGRGFTIGSNPGGLSDHFAHHPTSAHDAGSAEGAAVHRNTATCHEEIVNVLGVETAVRNVVSRFAVDLTVVYRNRNKRVLFCDPLLEFLFWIVKIDRPSGRDTGIGKFSFCGDVISGEDNVSFDSPRFTVASNKCHPHELSATIGLFDVGKGSEVCAKIPVADFLKVIDRVFVVAALPEPFGFFEFLIRSARTVKRGVITLAER